MELDIAPETGYARLLGITREDIAAMPDYEAFRDFVRFNPSNCKSNA